MECITALEPPEYKLNYSVRFLRGLRKRDSIRVVRERNQILAEKELHLKEIIKLFVILLTNDSPLEEIKSSITYVELENVSKSRSTCRSMKQSNSATDCSSNYVGVRVRKILNLKAMSSNKLENFISMCVQCYIQGNAELLSKFY